MAESVEAPAHEEESLRAKWEDRYQTGPTPWDTGITPPEVHAFWQGRTVSAGEGAVDIGCGTGLNTIFLARLGLWAVGVDVAGRALAKARRRLGAQPSPVSAAFVQADVSRLPLGRAGAVYALDIGCLHGLEPSRRRGYAAGVARVLRPGGYFHLFAFDEAPPGETLFKARGMADGEVAELFGPSLGIVAEERGIPSPRACRWYLLQKQ